MTKLFPHSLYLLVIILILLVPNTLQQPKALPSSVTRALASREMRYHHLLWHNIRNMWNGLSQSSRDKITELGWAPPRPAKDSSGRSLKNNNAGEDFLYMHRKMIEMVNKLIDKAGGTRVSGFKTLPAANDNTYPMPPAYEAPSGLTSLVEYYKSNTYYKSLKATEKKLKDPKFLRSMTLGQFGTYLEFTSDVHQGMHFRFSQYSKYMRPKSAPAIPYIDPSWDVTADRWLADIYASQVNPWFWKLHGWIDDRIKDWQKANGVTTIKWKGTWLGGNMNDLPINLDIQDNPNINIGGTSSQSNVQSATMTAMSMSTEENAELQDPNIGVDEVDPTLQMNMDLENMEKIANILSQEGALCDFYSDVGTITMPPPPADMGPH